MSIPRPRIAAARTARAARFRAPAGPRHPPPAGRSPDRRAGGPPYRIPVAPLTAFYLSQPPDGPDGSGSDGSGGGGGDDCRCGPDVTEWYKLQLPVIKKFAERNWAYGAYPNDKYKRLFANLKFENACLFNDDCPRCDACGDTVTLCGTCIDVTELGNIAYGYAADKRLPLVLWGGFFAQIVTGRGFDRYEDIVATIAGVAVGRRWDPGLPKLFCDSLKKPSGPQIQPGGRPNPAAIFDEMAQFNDAYFVYSRGTNVLGDWDASQVGIKFGGWQRFVRKALKLADGDGGPLAFLGRSVDDGCRGCKTSVFPGNITIRADGMPLLNGRPLNTKCPRN